MQSPLHNLDGAVAAAVALPLGYGMRSSWVGYALRGRTCLLDPYHSAVSLAVQTRPPAVFHIFVGAFLARVERLGDEPVEIFRVYRDLNTEPHDEPFGGEILYASEDPVHTVVSFDHLAGSWLADRAVLLGALLKPPFDAVPEALRAPPTPVMLTPRPEVYLATYTWLPHPGILRFDLPAADEQPIPRGFVKTTWVN
jgi:hypothetical protein